MIYYQNTILDTRHTSQVICFHFQCLSFWKWLILLSTCTKHITQCVCSSAAMTQTRYSWFLSPDGFYKFVINLAELRCSGGSRLSPDEKYSSETCSASGKPDRKDGHQFVHIVLSFYYLSHSTATAPPRPHQMRGWIHHSVGNKSSCRVAELQR